MAGTGGQAGDGGGSGGAGTGGSADGGSAGLGGAAGGGGTGGAAGGAGTGGGPPTAFRFVTLQLISPRITMDVPFGGCQDVTQNCASVFGGCVADSVSTNFANALNPTSAPNGTYSLHLIELFRPLSPAAASTPVELHRNAQCVEAPTPDSCGPAPVPNLATSNANNLGAATCFTPAAADVNARAGTPAMYSPTANTVGAPCFISDAGNLTIPFLGIDLPLTNARVAATYWGSPPSSLVSGLIVGFLSEAAAADIILPATLPVLGGESLYQHLQAGNRAVSNSAGTTIADGCNVGGGAHEDDADLDGTVRGFWFFLNFTADAVTWTGP
jgi:hypothetical protein